MALARDEETNHTCLMTPGKIGVAISPEGEVLSVKPGSTSQANRASIKAGWRVHSVEGEPYSQERLNSFVLGRKNYTLVFAEPTKARCASARRASAPAAPRGGYPATELMPRISVPAAPHRRYSVAKPEATAKAKPRSFKVTKGSCTKDIKLYKAGDKKDAKYFEGYQIEDLRARVQDDFQIVPWEQKLTFKSSEGDLVEIKADPSTPLFEIGLVDGEELYLAKQVDPRFKTEKETAFLEALAACRFEEAMQVLQSSGAKVSPDCVRTFGRGSQWSRANDPNWPHGTPKEYTKAGCICGKFEFGEDPVAYVYPALTVAMIAGTPRGSGILSEHDEKTLREARRHVAREPQVVKVVKLVLEMRANVNATGEEDHDGGSWPRSSPQGKTPLCAAVQRGSPTLVQMLLTAGADPNHTVTMGSHNLVPADFVKCVILNDLSERRGGDPRARYKEKILALLKTASEQMDAVEVSEMVGA